MTRILLAEDEPRIAEFVHRGLTASGFVVDVVHDGPAALAHAARGEHDLMVLDLGLPGLDGMAVLAELRRSGSAMPVIILSARDTVADTVAGLKGGADDYLRKPFAFEELLARVRLRLRGGTGLPAEDPELTAGGITLNLLTRRLLVNGRWIDLTAREFALAEYLMRHPDQVVSREQLLSGVWGLDFSPGTNVVNVYIRYLRAKVGEDRIETVRGAGYRFRA
ncbi:MAG: response regulator transcription factor [Propioniciclava sp.]|uniref:response regulator transcription factor n=1 Tax=Propioniciclava sp. TaxID=2038686 RepID=UPI0039E37E6D